MARLHWLSTPTQREKKIKCPQFSSSLDLEMKQKWKLMVSATLRVLVFKNATFRYHFNMLSFLSAGVLWKARGSPHKLGAAVNTRGFPLKISHYLNALRMLQLCTLKCGCQQHVFYSTIPPSFWCFLLNHSYSDVSINTAGNGSYTPFTGFKLPCPNHKLSSKGQQKFMSELSTSQREALFRNWWTYFARSKAMSTCKNHAMKFLVFPVTGNHILVITILLLHTASSIKS